MDGADQVRFAVRRFFSSAEAEGTPTEEREIDYRSALG
jgi:hypothetical protein